MARDMVFDVENALPSGAQVLITNWDDGRVTMATRRERSDVWGPPVEPSMDSGRRFQAVGEPSFVSGIHQGDLIEVRDWPGTKNRRFTVEHATATMVRAHDEDGKRRFFPATKVRVLGRAENNGR